MTIYIIFNTNFVKNRNQYQTDLVLSMSDTKNVLFSTNTAADCCVPYSVILAYNLKHDLIILIANFYFTMFYFMRSA